MAVFDDILDAVVTVAGGTTITVGSATVSMAFTRRKTAAMWEFEEFPADTGTVIGGVANVVGGDMTPMEEAFENLVLREYQVLIPMRFRGNQKLQTNLTVATIAEQTIRRALNTNSLSGVSAVWNTRVVEHPIYTGSAMNGNVDEALIELWYSTSEARNS